MERAKRSRWTQLVLGIVCMAMIANLQYGWTLFVLPIDQAHHWGRASIQLAFTIFVVTETWLVPFEGWVIDRLGPRPTVLLGGVLIGAAWMLSAVAGTLAVLYAAAALGGIGAGIVYGATVGNALKWFPDRRGLATGLTAAGFGAGSALTIVPISAWIATHGYASAFMVFGAVQGAVVAVAALALAAPPGNPPPAGVFAPGTVSSPVDGDFTPLRMLAEPVFWLMYLLFVLVGAGGLMATAQLAVVAADFQVAGVPVTLLGLTLPALTFALSIDRVLNGLTRPFFGWLSDHIGRENTMFIAFALEGAGILAMVRYAHDPLSFVLLSGVVFFAWGEIYSLFPATSGDTFGRRHATANYGLLYTAKGTAALIVPFGNLLRDATGSWTAVFHIAAAANLLAAVLALFVLKPLRRRLLDRAASPAPPAGVSAQPWPALRETTP
jgi:OFA family oxalate/formate antiporter-like MFS transporter